MKISLGIEFNKIRTIVSYYEEKSSRIKTIFNQPSCGMVMKRGFGQSYYGDLALNKDGVGFAYTFYPTLFIPNEDVLNPYFSFVLSNVFSTLGNEIIEVEYIIFTSGALDFKLKEGVFSYLKKEFKQLENTKLIFSKSKEVLNLSIIRSLNEIGKIDEEDILVLSLNDDSYQASLFNYQKGKEIPVHSTNIPLSYSSMDKFGIGSYGFIEAMCDYAVDSQDINIKAYYKKKEMSFEKFSLIRQIEDKLMENPMNLSYILEGKITFSFIANKERRTFVLSKEAYEYAMEKELYQKYDSLRKYLKDVKKETNNKTYKVIYQGKMTRYSEVIALIQSIFGAPRIIPEAKIYQDKLLKITDFNLISKGAALQSGMRYHGLIPRVSYKNYKDMNIQLIHPSDDFVLSESEKGVFFYRLNRELEIPLKTIDSNPDSFILFINNKEYDLKEFLYERGSLRFSRPYDRKHDTFIASLRIGIIEEKKNNKLLFELDNEDNRYHFEFELEVE